MEFQYVSRDVAVTPSMKEKVEKEMVRFGRFFKDPDTVHCTIRIEILKDRKSVEISLQSHDLQLRARAIDDDFYNAVDQIDEKLDRQMRKAKTQIEKSSHKKNSLSENMLLAQIEDSRDDAKDFTIVRRKTLNLSPMDVDEALARMDALGHSFFIYLDSKTGLVNVLYEREDHGYGVIEIENPER